MDTFWREPIVLSWTLLFEATKTNNVEAVRFLLSQDGVDVNVLCHQEREGYTGCEETALYYAVNNDFVGDAIVNLLQSAGGQEMHVLGDPILPVEDNNVALGPDWGDWPNLEFLSE